MAVVLVIICIAAIAGIYRFRLRGGAKAADLVSYLPTANATVIYVDVNAIRSAGILGMIAGSKAAEELEYQQFVDETQFDYRQDLDAVAAAFKDGQVFFALRGRFHWKNLMDYAVRQGGDCHNSFCTADASRPNRRISFYPIKPDLMAMAISSDDFAAYQITRRAGRLALQAPNQPAWAIIPALALKDADSLPAGTKAYVSALKNVQEIVFAIGPQGDHLQLSLNAACRDAQEASALAADFENTTSTLRNWIAREHQQPNPADLSGVLVAGTFRHDKQRVFGEWPITRAFVEALAAEPR